MFESAELGHAIDKKTYEQQVPALREALLAAQFDLVEKKSFPVVVVVGGVDGAGKGETVNLLNEWMDARHIETHALGRPTREEKERPAAWRFWRRLPPKGRIGIFFGAWHTMPILSRAYGEIGNAELDDACQEIVRFERMLADEGALILKFWFHLSKDRQKKRLRALSKDPKTAWRVTDTDWQHFELYDTFRKVCERALRQTSTAQAPWIVVEGTCANYRSLTVGRTIHDALRKRLDAEDAVAATAPGAPPAAPAIDGRTMLRSLELKRALSRDEYAERLDEAQRRINLVSRSDRFKRKRSAVVVFEGPDAGGKGGAVRRVTRALDARQYTIVPVAAPTEEERAQPYLWRFWRHVPGRGRFAIFDRSWYGRVLVERVEGFARERDWLRAYEEINDFEAQLAAHGAVVVKFWLQVSKEEQLRRFQAREATGFKHYKITPEDWRNRDKWDLYEQAAGDAFDRTSTADAPWTLVEADDKLHARVKVLETLAARLERAI